jgi:hypothetical protein
VKLIAFCEAPSDFRMASGLVDRVLREVGPTWAVDNLDAPGVVLRWHADGLGNDFIKIRHLNQYTDQLRERGLRVRPARGHFNGRPGESGSAMARKAFLIAEALTRHGPDDPIDAVVLVMDTDDEPVERPRGVKAARDEALGWKLFQIVCGFADPEREAWVLAGFDACDPIEQQRLDELHRELGFSPVLHAVRLRDKAHGVPRNIKRVLAVLTGDDIDREARCWTEPPLATLHDRGAATGLSAFLVELQAVLPGLLGAGPSTDGHPAAG